MNSRDRPVRRRYRRKVVDPPTPFHEGQPVAVESPDVFRGRKLGVVIGKCRHDDGIMVRLVSPGDIGFTEVCIQTQRGDKIDPVAK